MDKAHAFGPNEELLIRSLIKFISKSYASGNITSGFQKDELFIRDIGDGGAKHDKFERDIRLLLDGIKEEPNNVRYYFYLAY